MNITGDRMKFLRLLSEKYPTRQQVCTEIINLQAILNLPKGTEHFMSDLHGEYEAFFHILNNSAGVIREKVDMAFEEVLTARERSSLCTLIYYPQEKLRRIREEGRNTEEWYRFVLQKLIDLAKLLSSKYTRSKVRKAMPSEYSYILDELLHAQPDEDNNQLVYHSKIIDTLLRLEEGDDFIIALSSLIKRLAVDHLHIVGDIFDRGERPDAILNMLMDHHSLDIEWGNHDILWMGAACGSQACIAAVVRNCLSYNNISVLEQGYGISLRPLVLFAEKMYDEEDPNKAAKKAISIILFKLEGQIIRRNPEYQMEDRLLLDKVDYENACIELDGKSYPLKEKHFPTVDRDDPYKLSQAEREIMDELEKLFLESEQLQRHVEFLYSHGSMYQVFNGNLLFHACVPLNADGSLMETEVFGETYKGRALYDVMERYVRAAFDDAGNPVNNFGCPTPTGLVEFWPLVFETYCVDKANEFNPGKFDLVHEMMPHYDEPKSGPKGDVDMNEYPIILTTGRRIPVYFHSEHRQLPWCRELWPVPRVEMNPNDAGRLGLKQGDWVWLETPWGKVREVLDLYYGISQGVINANHAWWFPEFDTASHGFELVGINVVNDPYGQDTVGGCATMRSTPTIVYKATAENSPFGNPVPCDPNGVECIHDASDPRLREWVPTGKGVRARFEGEPEWDGSVM